MPPMTSGTSSVTMTNNHRAASPGIMGKARSTGDLTPTRQGHNQGSPTARKDAERPRPGCVAEKVSVFESRCRSQTPRGMRNVNETRAPPAYVHTLPRERHAPVASGVNRAGTGGMMPPVLPRATPALVPRGFGGSMHLQPEETGADTV